MHRGALGSVEHAGLEKHLVRRQTHFAPQRVQFPHQVALGGAADGGIAGHHGQRIQVQGHKQGFVSHAGAGQGCLAARVSRANDDDVILFHGKKAAFRSRYCRLQSGNAAGFRGIFLKRTLPVPDAEMIFTLL